MNDDDLRTLMAHVATDADPTSEVRKTVLDRLSRRTVRRRNWMVAAAAAATVGLVGSISVLASPVAREGGPARQQDPQTTGSSARCYASAELNAVGRNFLSVTLGDRSGGGVLRGTLAQDICRDNWSSGTLSLTEPHIVDNPQHSPAAVPDLVVCVLPAGDEGVPEIAVVPGSAATCTDLDLEQYID